MILDKRRSFYYSNLIFVKGDEKEEYMFTATQRMTQNML